jgi:hypothetical protein
MSSTDDNQPTAVPLPRLGWRMQAVLDAMLEDPSREVWPYWLDRHSRSRSENDQVLRRLAEAGWLTVRRETGKPNARVLYRLTPTGEAMAREAVKRQVKWPDGVSRRRHDRLTDGE